MGSRTRAGSPRRKKPCRQPGGGGAFATAAAVAAPAAGEPDVASAIEHDERRLCMRIGYDFPAR